jgi:hypothetical protein
MGHEKHGGCGAPDKRLLTLKQLNEGGDLPISSAAVVTW